MASKECTPIQNNDRKPFFKVPAVPRKQINKSTRPPLSKVQIPITALFGTDSISSTTSSSPCVQLGQKRPTFPFSPAKSTPKSSAGSGSRFFCEDDWEAWKENMERIAVETSNGRRPPTPPSWVATPHRSGLHQSRHGRANLCEIGIRRRLLSAQIASREKSNGQLAANNQGKEPGLTTSIHQKHQ